MIFQFPIFVLFVSFVVGILFRFRLQLYDACL
jgi:hypothetical protein